MKNSDYWKERFLALEDEQYQKMESYYKDIEKQFRMAQNSVQIDIEKWYWRLADNNNISYAAARRLLKKAELEEFHWTVEEYIKYGEENAINQKWIKQLQNASARVHISRLEAIKLQMQQHAEKLFLEYEGKTEEFLKTCYEDVFYHTAFEVARGTGVGSSFAKLNTNLIDKVLKKPWAQDGGSFSERIWRDKGRLVNTLHTELAQNIIRGEHPVEAAKRVAEEMGVSLKRAKTLVYTESAAIASSARKDCFDELGVEKYEIVATLDNRTSEICQEMDGKVFDRKEYEVGLTAPPFHCNCRSCTCPYFNDEFTIGEERAARSEETGKTYYVPANMKYPEWKEIFVDKEKANSLYNIIDKNRSINYNNTKTQEALLRVAQQVKEEVTDYTKRPSKWSGKIKIDNSLKAQGSLGRKEWNCDIVLIDSVDDGVVWHELLHSCSVSYFDSMIYSENQYIEEATVEFLKQQICKEKGIAQQYAYESLVLVLQAVNARFNYGTDMEFAKELFNIPLPIRYQFLEDKVDASLRELNVSFEDYNEVMQFVESLKGGD